MPDWNSVPWSHAEMVDTAVLCAAVLVLAAIPTIYSIRANLRDPLARAVLAGSSATAVVFMATLGFLVATHAGWTPSEGLSHWIVRVTYAAVAVGNAALLYALLRVLRDEEKTST